MNDIKKIYVIAAPCDVSCCVNIWYLNHEDKLVSRSELARHFSNEDEAHHHLIDMPNTKKCGTNHQPYAFHIMPMYIVK